MTELALEVVDTLTGELVIASSPSAAADVATKAKALLNIARAIGLKGRELNKAAGLRVEAMAKAGRLLTATVRRGGKSKSHGGSSMPLPEGITPNQSSRWQAVARVPVDIRADYFAECDQRDEEITVAGVLQALRVVKRGENAASAEASSDTADTSMSNLSDIIATGVRFGCIYADPPWQYGNQATRASTDNHYPTMPIDDICALPIREIAADDAHIHLWTTNGFLFEAKRVMESWGFEYKSCFVWVKPQMGIGNYWRVSHEFLLLGVRGSCGFLKHDLKSWAELPRAEHSAKPDKIREMIESVSPGPRIELFSRERIDGWSAWGNQTKSNLFTQKGVER